MNMLGTGKDAPRRSLRCFPQFEVGMDQPVRQLHKRCPGFRRMHHDTVADDDLQEDGLDVMMERIGPFGPMPLLGA